MKAACLRDGFNNIQWDAMPKFLLAPLVLSGLLVVSHALAEGDSRIAVVLPMMMQDHMRANMRDHLLSINEILGLLAVGFFVVVVVFVVLRIGMSSLEAHGV